MARQSSAAKRQEDAYQLEDITGKAVVITGGTTGIGRATAVKLAMEGAKVLIFGRHEEELRDALHDLREIDGVHGMIADVTRREDVVRVFAEAERVLGGIDILINNAGLSAESVGDTHDGKVSSAGYETPGRFEAQLLRRHPANPILTAAPFPRPVNSVFNAGAVKFDGKTPAAGRFSNRTAS
jgi:NAD(P)-dependent dehydrogenase (short-subunit alcohol dehydrogenase family)